LAVVVNLSFFHHFLKHICHVLTCLQFDSGCGWPAFYAAVPGALTYKEDKTFGMHRIEMRCAKCDSHLGHVFRGEGYKNPVDERHCVNSVCLKLDKQADPKEFKWESFEEKKGKN
jgi:peptide methionine sulfoxide reductase MsrB